MTHPLIPPLLYVFLCFDQYTVEDKLRVLYIFYPSRPSPLVSKCSSAHSSPSSHPLLIHVRMCQSCFSRLCMVYGKGRSGVVPSSCVVLRGFSGLRGAGAAFGRVKYPQARAKCVDYRTYYAIAEFDLGHQVSCETTAGDDVIPRSWTIPYTASAFWFEKFAQPTNLPVQKKEKTN